MRRVHRRVLRMQQIASTLPCLCSNANNKREELGMFVSTAPANLDPRASPAMRLKLFSAGATRPTPPPDGSPELSTSLTLTEYPSAPRKMMH